MTRRLKRDSNSILEGKVQWSNFVWRALTDGAERIVAVGDDGTLHEVVDGFFEDQSPIAPSAVLAFVACGSGSDFRHALGAPTGVEAVQQLRSDRIQPLDVLRVRYMTEQDRCVQRYAINIASAGLSGAVVRHFSSSGLLPLPPRLHCFRAALRALALNRPVLVRLILDGEPLPPCRVRIVAVANGHTFAAGLPIAPTARTPSRHLSYMANTLPSQARVLMATPQLEDDGTKVTLDLHGLSVDEAIDLTYSTLRLAKDRGRNRLKVIHGSSTTQSGHRRTIKSELHTLLDRGGLGAHATDVVRSRDTLTFVLDLTAASDSTPIQLQDVWA